MKKCGRDFGDGPPKYRNLWSQSTHTFFCTNDYIAEIYSKIAFNISTVSYSVHVQEI